MLYLYIFFISFIVIFITYIVFFYKKVNKNGDITLFIKNNTVLSIIMALVISITLGLMSLELQLTSILIFLALGFIENNIFTPIIFKVGYLDIVKKEGIIAAIVSKLIVFVVLYFILLN